jgi:hypothetical protein
MGREAEHPWNEASARKRGSFLGPGSFVFVLTLISTFTGQNREPLFMNVLKKYVRSPTHSL